MFYKLNLFWTIIKWFTLWGMNFLFKKKSTHANISAIFSDDLWPFFMTKSLIYIQKKMNCGVFLWSHWTIKDTFFVNCLYMMTTDRNIHRSSCFKLHWPALNYTDLNGRSTIFIWRSQSDEHDPICKLQIAMLFMMRFLKTESATACQTFF